jgi:hypothetical protein
VNIVKSLRVLEAQYFECRICLRLQRKTVEYRNMFDQLKTFLQVKRLCNISEYGRRFLFPPEERKLFSGRIFPE